ncbi:MULTISPECIES: caspase, EACC1-associated type [Streptomyces]|uniref:caspase, EACC1-associated type n=1 Tax=Streptomyces TaxID=1883 RepID=UPI00068F26C5|nr:MULTISPECIES: SAV_2336 N-terminal domain-related protein [Streptomyces]
MFEELLKVLARGPGLPMEEELLDVLWLAPRVPSGPAAPLALRAPETTDPQSPSLDAVGPDARPPGDAPAGTGPAAAAGREETAGSAAPSDAHLAIVSSPSAAGPPAGALWTPGGRALGPTLPLGRALRPLKRRVPSRHHSGLDEAATAALQADTRSPHLVLRAQPERWLRLALVIDGGVSMPLWQRQCADLKDLFERSGAFRQVVTHQIRCAPGSAEVRLARPWSTDPQTRAPGSVADGSGRTMVLVVTDGAAPAWRDGRLRPVLEGWARSGPTAVLHTLPRRLWAGSGVRADTWRVVSPRPGAVNTAWTVTDQVLPPTVAPPPPVPVPVVELTPAGLATWSAVNTVVARPVPVPLWSPHRPEAPAVSSPGPVSVGDFARAASPEALRLAAHLAAMAPVTVPVMQLVHAHLDRRQDTTPLAEVFLGGLLQPLPADHSAGRHRLFDFTPEAKDLLLDAVPTTDLLACSRRVGEHIESLVGRSSDFPAWPLSQDARGSAAPFAHLGPALQARLGVPEAAASTLILSPAEQSSSEEAPAKAEFPWVSGEGLDASLRLLAGELGVRAPEVTLPLWDQVTGLVDSVAESRGEPPPDVRPRLREQYLDALLPLCPRDVVSTFSRVRDAPEDSHVLLLHLLMYVHDRPTAARMTQAEIVEDLVRYLDERGLSPDRERRLGWRRRFDLLWHSNGRYCPVEIKRAGSPFSWPPRTQVAELMAVDDSLTRGFLVAVDEDEKPDGPVPLDECVAVWPDLSVVALRFQNRAAAGFPTPPVSFRVCIVVDIAGHGKMSAATRHEMAGALRDVIDDAVRTAGNTRPYLREDRGDGSLVLLSEGVDESVTVPGFVEGLARGLRHARERGNVMRVRVAMTAGVIAMGELGATGEAVQSAARLADSAVLRESEADYALIVSESLYQDVPGFHGRFRRVRVKHEDFESWAWLHTRSSRLPDPERSTAVLIGTGSYTELPDLPQVHAGLRDLALLLTHPLDGGFSQERSLVLENPESGSELLDVVGHAAASAEDTLLVYFAGHGLYDSVSGELSLAVAGSRPDAPVTAVPLDDVRELVLHSAARHKIVILDCCYSGRVGRQALPGVFNIVPDRDVTVLAASLQRAATAPGDAYTAFTGALIDVLRDGVTEGSESISLRELYEEARRRLAAGNFPLPTLSAHNDTERVALARNNAG